MTRPHNIHHQLAASTWRLLVGSSHAINLIASGDNWKIDSALLIYAEKNRVSLAEGIW